MFTHVRSRIDGCPKGRSLARSSTRRSYSDLTVGCSSWLFALSRVYPSSPAAAAGARISRRANAIDGARRDAALGRAHHDDQEADEEEGTAGARVPVRQHEEAAPGGKAAANVFRGGARPFVPSGRHRFPPLPRVAGGASSAAGAAGADTYGDGGGRKRRFAGSSRSADINSPNNSSNGVSASNGNCDGDESGGSTHNNNPGDDQPGGATAHAFAPTASGSVLTAEQNGARGGGRGGSGAAGSARARVSGGDAGGRKSNTSRGHFPPLLGKAKQAAKSTEETGDNRLPARNPFQRHKGRGKPRSSSRAIDSSLAGSTRARSEPRGTSSGGGHEKRKKKMREVEAYYR